MIEPAGDDGLVVKRSFGDVLTRYPDEINAQRFFFEACGAPTRPRPRRLLAFVK